MKMMLLIWLGVFTLPMASSELKLSELRKLYYQAAESSAASATLSRTLKAVDAASEPIFLCYKGAAHMMEAEYTLNPITKLSRFNKGKTAIEQAIARDPSQLEMRFIRFSLQVNLPAFLGYKGQIEADKKKLLAGVASINDKVLKENVVNYLIASKKCTKEEIKKLQN